MWRHRPHRLKAFGYVGMHRYSLTLCTFRREHRFVSHETVAPVLVQLRQHAAAAHFAVIAYCFMPDHLHLLVQGTREDSDLEGFAARFKQVSGYGYGATHKKVLWQDGYFDRVLRDDEDTLPVCRYIVANPVRKGFTSSLGEYPFAGSDLYSMKDIIDAFCTQG